MYVCMHVCMCVCMYVCECINVGMYVYVCMYACMHVCMCACMWGWYRRGEQRRNGFVQLPGGIEEFGEVGVHLEGGFVQRVQIGARRRVDGLRMIDAEAHTHTHTTHACIHS